MLKFIQNNYKLIIIIVIASFVICYSRTNLRNSGSISFLFNNEIYQYSGDGINNLPMTISDRIKKEVEKCGIGYAISDWTFEKDVEIYRNNSIWGCTAEFYKEDNDICPMNLKIYNSAYNQNYNLPKEWFYDLLKKSSNKDDPHIYGCSIENLENCQFIKENNFFRYQLFCSIMNSISPTECNQILQDKLKTPQFLKDNSGNLTEIRKTNKEITEEFINNIVRTRSPIKNFRFAVIKEKDERFLRVFIITDLSNNNYKCEKNAMDLKLISIINYGYLLFKTKIYNK